jgi:hypothetical protein
MLLPALSTHSSAALDILVIGSTRSYSERGETGVVHRACRGNIGHVIRDARGRFCFQWVAAA